MGENGSVWFHQEVALKFTEASGLRTRGERSEERPIDSERKTEREQQAVVMQLGGQ